MSVTILLCILFMSEVDLNVLSIVDHIVMPMVGHIAMSMVYHTHCKVCGKSYLL